MPQEAQVLTRLIHDSSIARFPPERAIGYLRRNQLLDADTLVNGRVRAEERLGRHDSCCVRVEDGGHFIKWARADLPHAGDAIGLEAEVLKRIWARPNDPLQQWVPRLVHFDPREHVLVTELILGTSPATTARQDGSVATLRIGAALGRALAACHRRRSFDEWPSLRTTPPGCLDMARPAAAALRTLSSGQLELRRVIQQHRDACDAMASVRDTWTATTLVHGDLRSANVLVSADPSEPDRPSIKLVDWELASLGEPAADLGGAFQGFLSDAAYRVACSATDVASIDDRFGECLPSIQGEIADLVDTYLREADDETTGGRRRLLRRSIVVCGARLLQTAHEWAHDDVSPSRHAVTAAQLGINMLERIDDSCRAVLGIPLEDEAE